MTRFALSALDDSRSSNAWVPAGCGWTQVCEKNMKYLLAATPGIVYCYAGRSKKLLVFVFEVDKEQS